MANCRPCIITLSFYHCHCAMSLSCLLNLGLNDGLMARMICLEQWYVIFVACFLALIFVLCRLIPESVFWRKWCIGVSPYHVLVSVSTYSCPQSNTCFWWEIPNSPSSSSLSNYVI
jgi:hypothetical protein